MYKLYKRGRVWYGDFHHGRERMRRSLGVSNKEMAKRIAEEVESKSIDGRLGILHKAEISFAELCEKFLAFSRSTHSRRTTSDYSNVIKRNLCPFFGKMMITGISTEAVENFKSRSLSSNNAVSVNKFIRYLKSILGKGVSWGYLTANPASGVKEIPVGEKAIRYLDEKEMAAIVAHAGEWRAFFITALSTGMRKAELFSLRWTDVDFENREITVTNRAEFHTKNYRNRTIPMTAGLYDALLDHNRKKVESSDYVFCREGGQPLADIRKTLSDVIERSGVRKFTLHDLRRTFASQLAFQSVDIATIQKLMGHQSATTTMRYTLTGKARLEQAVQKLPAINV